MENSDDKNTLPKEKEFQEILDNLTNVDLSKGPSNLATSNNNIFGEVGSPTSKISKMPQPSVHVMALRDRSRSAIKMPSRKVEMPADNVRPRLSRKVVRPATEVKPIPRSTTRKKSSKFKT